MKVVKRTEAFWDIAIPPSGVKILKFLAIAGLQNRYEIMKGTGLSYPRVHENIESLKKFNLVGEKVVGKAEKTGLPLKKYSLTLWGLTNALVLQNTTMKFEDRRRRMGSIATNYGELLPFIFGKWSYFDKLGVKDTITYSLFDAVIEAASSRKVEVIGFPPPQARKIAETEFRKRVESELKDYITGQTLINPLMFPRIDYRTEKGIKTFETNIPTYVKALVGDPEIKAFVLSYLKKMKKEALAHDTIEKAVRQNRPSLILKRLRAPQTRGEKDRGGVRT